MLQAATTYRSEEVQQDRHFSILNVVILKGFHTPNLMHKVSFNLEHYVGHLNNKKKQYRTLRGQRFSNTYFKTF